MVAKSLKWALAGLIVFPTAALALGLGDIHLKSTLDAPLDANIEILGATPDQMANLKPKIASRDIFAQHGLDWSPFLADVTIRAVHLANGHDVLEVRSTQPVTEPFLTLLVQLNWQRGEFLREYDVLLDPPVYTPHQSEAASAVAAPVTGPGAREGTIKRAPVTPPAASAPSTETATSAPTQTPSAPSAVAPSDYDVHRGDTLSGIAAQFAGSSRADRQRWMLAAYETNPASFDHNMNWLRAGTVLRMPSASAVDGITAADASAAVHRQYVAWRSDVARVQRSGQQPGRLRLVAPTQAGSTSASAAAGGSGEKGVKALQAQVQSLQSQLASSQRLLALKSAQLQQLQAQLAARQGEAPQAPAPSASASAASAAKTSAQPAPAPQATPVVKKPAAVPRRPAVHRAPAASHPGRVVAARSWLDEVEGLWWVIALAIVALLGYFGLKGFASRRKAGFDESLGRLAEAGAGGHDEDLPIPEPPLEAKREPTRAGARESAIVVEESGTHERPRLDVTGAGAPTTRHIEADDTVSGETAIKLDQGDPLAEADFHMAYGLYDQAADLVRIAIQREPQRRDLKLKLLEVFFVWGNKEQFLQTARELAATRAEAGPGEWDKIVIMGKQLAAEDPLFAGGSGVSGAAAGGVDLDLEGGQHQVDFDVAGEEERHSGEGVDLDIGTAIGERDAVAEAAAHQATDRNLALDDSMVLSDDATAERDFATPTRRMTGMVDEGTSATREMTGTTREMEARRSEMNSTTREMTTTLEQESWDPTELMPEAPTVEHPVLNSPDNPPIRQKVEMALKAGGGEHTAELALDDLGLDLDHLPDGSAPASEEAPHESAEADSSSAEDAPTLVAGLDEHSRRVIETAQHREVSEGDELKVSQSGTWHFDEDPYAGEGASSGNGHAREDVADTARQAALKSDGIDFEIGEPTQVAPSRLAGASGNGHGGNGSGGVDLDVGSSQEPPDAGFQATQRLPSDDLALPDLEPVTMSEVGTKLDLARAYMDMGDPEGARNILEEVLGEGSSAQKQEAERLIASLPG
jgi:pilus assembly protein FimV